MNHLTFKGIIIDNVYLVVFYTLDVNIITFGTINCQRNPTFSKPSYNHVPIGTCFLPSFSYPSCKQYSALLSRNVSMNIIIKVFLHWLVARSSMRRLKGALKTTSSSCTKLVHPGGINIPYSLKFSRTKIFVDFVVLKHPRKFYPRKFQPIYYVENALYLLGF